MSWAENQRLYEVYRMAEDQKETMEMLADPTSPFWAKVVSGITMEQIYQTQRAALARQGMLITRLGFLNVAGIVSVTPRGMAKLAELGVEVKGFSITAIAPPNPAPNGR